MQHVLATAALMKTSMQDKWRRRQMCQQVAVINSFKRPVVVQSLVSVQVLLFRCLVLLHVAQDFMFRVQFLRAAKQLIFLLTVQFSFHSAADR